MTDLNWENFGVDAAGKVRILDAENIIVVDKLALEASEWLFKVSSMLIQEQYQLPSRACISFTEIEIQNILLGVIKINGENGE